MFLRKEPRKDKEAPETHKRHIKKGGGMTKKGNGLILYS